jgi:glucokinase
VGAVTGDGEVLLETSAATHRDGPGTAQRLLLELIVSVRSAVEARGLGVTGIGVGIPGIVDAETGIVGDLVPHVPELQGVPLAPVLAERLRLPVFIDNDVNAHALAEWMFGLARGVRSVVVLALGTGLGAGLVLDGHLVRGAGGYGGELGHSPVKFDGPPCWCGGRGCLALYASGRGIAEAARARVAGDAEAPLLVAAGGDPRRITAPLVFRAAAEKDPVAIEIVGEACEALGAMIGTIVNGLNPDVVVITGGVATSLLSLEIDVLRAAGQFAFARALALTRVRIVPGDKRVTMRGAAALVLYELQRRERDTSARP